MTFIVGDRVCYNPATLTSGLPAWRDTTWRIVVLRPLAVAGVNTSCKTSR
jgi:hypothetical protein